MFKSLGITTRNAVTRETRPLGFMHPRLILQPNMSLDLTVD